MTKLATLLLLAAIWATLAYATPPCGKGKLEARGLDENDRAKWVLIWGGDPELGTPALMGAQELEAATGLTADEAKACRTRGRAFVPPGLEKAHPGKGKR